MIRPTLYYTIIRNIYKYKQTIRDKLGSWQVQAHCASTLKSNELAAGCVGPVYIAYLAGVICNVLCQSLF